MSRKDDLREEYPADLIRFGERGRYARAVRQFSNESPPMREVAITELRARASHFFGLVERGATLRITRHGRPIADIRPVTARPPSRKRRSARPLSVGGSPISDLILADRGR